MDKSRFNCFKNCKNFDDILNILQQKIESEEYELVKDYVYDNLDFLYKENVKEICSIYLLACAYTEDDIHAYRFISLAKEMPYINQETEEFLNTLEILYNSAKQNLSKLKNQKESINIEKIKESLYYGNKQSALGALIQIYSLQSEGIDLTKTLVAALKIRKYYDETFFLIFMHASLLNLKDTITFEKNFVSYSLNLADYRELFSTFFKERDSFLEYCQKNLKSPSNLQAINVTITDSLAVLFPEYLNDFDLKAFFKSCIAIAYLFYARENPTLEPTYNNYKADESKVKKYVDIIFASLKEQKNNNVA